MTIRIALAVALFTLVPQASVLAADAKAVTPPATTGQPVAGSTQEFPGKERAVAFLRAIALGDSAGAYAMFSDAARRKTSAATFNEALAPLMKAGITQWYPKTLKTTTSSFGYDSEIGVYRELKTTITGGTLLTRHAGSMHVSLSLIALGDVWQSMVSRSSR